MICVQFQDCPEIPREFLLTVKDEIISLSLKHVKTV